MNKKLVIALLLLILLATKIVYANTLSFVFPVYGIPIQMTAIFNAYRDYDGDGIRDDLHEGIDFRATDSLGNPVYVRAVMPGRVTWASDKDLNGYYASPYGNHVIVDHGNGIWTTYAHLSDIFVRVGDEVTPSLFLGLSGSTGHSTGTHLHFHLQDFKNGDQGYAVPYIEDPTALFNW